MNSNLARRLSGAMALALVALLLISSSSLAAENKSLGKLTAIEVQGNSRIDSETILAQMTLKIGDELTEAAVNESFAKLDNMGCFADLGANTASYLGGIKLIVIVREFPVVGRVNIVGNRLIASEPLLALMTTRVGEQLNHNKLRADLEAIAKHYSDKGYWVSVEPSLNESAELTVNLVEWIVSDVRIEGNEKTKLPVIKRSIELKAGDYIDINKINNDRRSVYMLGAFEDVEAKVEPVPGKAEFVVTYVLTERKTGTANMSLSYSSSTGIMGFIEMGDDNFLGNAQKVNAKAEFGWGKANYELGFNEPRLGASGKTSLGFNIYNKTADKKFTPQPEEGSEEQPEPIGYSQRRTGGDLSLGRSLSLNTRAFLKLKLDNAVNKAADSAYDDVIPKGGITRSVTLSAVNDARNDLWNPSKGYRLSGSVEYAGGILGGDNNFTKLEAEGAAYLQLHEKHILAGRLSGGSGISALPDHERFRIGGAETVRGYKYGDLEGDRMVFGNAEYRFTLTKGLQGVLFCDAGQAWDVGGSFDFANTKVGYGLGVRVTVPVLGTIRVDYGISKDQGGQAYFSFGQTF